MGWKQIKSFSVSKMGTKKGWCLQNVRLGFGITAGKYTSAKADMLAQKAGGTLHVGNNVPTNVAVPIYIDTTSKYEHVVVSDHGVIYSDGKRISDGLKVFTVFGWGELCDGVRVVEATSEPNTSFLPSKGYWCYGDKDERIGKLAIFMRSAFPAYTSTKALGSYYGPYLQAAIKEFQKRTGLQVDGSVGPKTYAKLKEYGFKG